ncbi:unnamed protein product [Medioppia subpectinata]|uniref:Protein kinase domain-containing protein n=1 Tax=Medioppia subpectinata TaxID=1979941 RepID=A0A7R9LAF4_9ACAR|nr:unnamed protein product [Medioppia subpectinata]CAG2117256.1 unnamed protein product [Medioppia subpectinata]
MKIVNIDEFNELNLLGRGEFGTVYKVVNKLDGEVKAIKIVHLQAISDEHRHQVLKEIKSLAKVRSRYVVQYHNSWLDTNRLYIQMEYCPQSLRLVLADKALAFGRQSAEPMNPLEYYKSCEIFKELLESVQYLHERRPPIIHRNLKPENVLTVNGLDGDHRSRRFIKLGDFGLANVYLRANHVNNDSLRYRAPELMTGALWYVAPEVFSGYNDSHKLDMWSLARIGTELFDVDPCEMTVDTYPDDHVLNGPVVRLHRMLQLMMNWPVFDDRPECRQVLAKRNEWSIDKP